MYLAMIRGALVQLPGQKPIVMERGYSPQELGQFTIWQLRHVFGFKEESPRLSHQEAFWKRKRLLGCSEFEIWRDWHAMMEVVQGQTNG